MKILVCGASGFIGKAICQRLAAEGHDIVRGVRRPQAANDLGMDFSVDFSTATWRARLAGIDAVVNAVGIIVETKENRFDDIHHRAPAALFAACAQANVKRIVQISALGAETGTTAYYRTKLAADRALMESSVEWQILRPALIYGDDGTSAALFRALASLPVIPVPRLGGAMFRPTHIDDLVEAVRIALDPATPPGQCVDVVGKTSVTYRKMIETYRHAMGFGGGLVVSIPGPPMACAARITGLIPGALFTADTWRMLRAGNTADADGIACLLGRSPRGAESFIAPERAELLRHRALAAWRTPLLRVALAVVWLVTAYVSLFAYPIAGSLELLARTGLTGFPALVALYGAALLDFVMGIATLCYPSKRLWLAQAALVLGYTAIIALRMPDLLLHPFGPVLKNFPFLAILAILLAEEK